MRMVEEAKKNKQRSRRNELQCKRNSNVQVGAKFKFKGVLAVSHSYPLIHINYLINKYISTQIINIFFYFCHYI